MNNEQLNILAVKAREGSEVSYHEILQHFLPKIYRMSQNIWHSVVNETHFEQSCLVGIQDAIKRFDPEKGAFSTQVNYRFRQALWRSTTRLKKRRRGYEIDSLDVSSSDVEDERSNNYEVEDNLAVIDDSILVHEKIALLAEDDSRKLAILNAWSNGEYNDSDTASFLAKRYGGNSESHRKFINRFRTTCQKALAYPLTS
ncbi:hypothetical protein [Paenibacillus sp. YIM B09110]|uniref:hypothetical protein n=1 Tax=Paenibacillus sp. YIM B09110 TaxID=3126102 RepID=UPI00301D3BC5